MPEQILLIITATAGAIALGGSAGCLISAICNAWHRRSTRKMATVRNGR